MKSVLQEGACVSCGRWSGRYSWSCPYCGEQVWHSMWWRLMCALLVGLPPVLVTMLVMSSRPDFALVPQVLGETALSMRILCAAGFGLLLLPYADDKCVVSSLRELVQRQTFAVCGGVLMAGYAGILAICLSCGKDPLGVLGWIQAILLMLCVSAAPCFFKLPWRAVATSLLWLLMIAAA